MKFCARCQQTKQAAEFGRNSARKDGLHVAENLQLLTWKDNLQKSSHLH